MSDFKNESYEIEIKGDIDPETRKELIRTSIAKLFDAQKENDQQELKRFRSNAIDNMIVLIIALVMMVIFLTMALVIVLGQ